VSAHRLARSVALRVDLARRTTAKAPGARLIAAWAAAALGTRAAGAEIAVQVVSPAASRRLNHHYRGKDKPTNVLSFPMVQPDLLETVTANSDDGEVLLGDIVLAHGVCAAEAAERGISVETHATHLIVHGVLHLLGYDHVDDREAEAMEAIETDALASLGIADPYLINED